MVSISSLNIRVGEKCVTHAALPLILNGVKIIYKYIKV